MFLSPVDADGLLFLLDNSPLSYNLTDRWVSLNLYHDGAMVVRVVK
jgi:hypothetical protein